jgi:hypothetical protein
VQLRLWQPFDANWVEPPLLTAEPDLQFEVRRARLKVEANAFRPWFKLNFEQDFQGNGVLNLYATVEKYDWLQFRAGQFKAQFSRERVTSSGRQQFADRSIVNHVFTIDRQVGGMVLGHLFKGTRADSWYSFGLFTGTGRGNWFEEGGSPMLVARYQWNLFGKDLEFSSSDLEYHEQPAAAIAAVGAKTRGRYTRFSSDGGGQLEGFEPGVPGQYSLKQALGEAFLKFRGFSVQQEYHWKNVYDHVNSRSVDMSGAYAQAGYFPHYAATWIPKALETGYRYAWVDPHAQQPNDLHQEHSLVANWFFEGHDNKLVFEAARLAVKVPGGGALSSWRYRLQWDVHF